MTFNKWLDTFVSEKGFNLEHMFEVEGPEWGMNMIPLEAVIEFAKTLDKDTKAKIKNNFVMIDFRNGDCLHFFEFMAKGMAR